MEAVTICGRFKTHQFLEHQQSIMSINGIVIIQINFSIHYFHFLFIGNSCKFSFLWTRGYWERFYLQKDRKSKREKSVWHFSHK